MMKQMQNRSSLDEALAAFAAQKPGYETPVRTFLHRFSLTEIGAVQPALALEYVKRLQAQQLAPRSIDQYRRAVHSFLRWLLEQGQASFSQEQLVEVHHAQAQILRPYPAPDPRFASDEAVRDLLAAAYAVEITRPITTPRGRRLYLERLRNIALLEALRSTGARPFELRALSRGDLRPEQQQALAPDGRVLYFDVRAWGALANYLAAAGGDPALPLFWSTRPVFLRHDPAAEGRNLRITQQMLHNLVVRLRGASGITARAIRHRFARKVLAASRDPDGTAALMGITPACFRERYRAEIRRVLGRG